MKLTKFFLLFSLIAIGLIHPILSQTIGLQHYSLDVFDGYTLFSPEKNQKVYLINNCGEIVNEWAFSEIPGATCYLLEDGTLLRAGKDSLEIRDWDNSLLWSYAMNNNGFSQHHDIEPLPNGNILCLLRDILSPTQIIEHGRDSTLIGNNFKLDRIVELQPVGSNSANVVWEWKFLDHFIQDIDSTKANFGIVEDHPELIDLNYDNGQVSDWTHGNAIDYNPVLDQVLITSRHLSEIYIIDHSTTTAEAASHTGGNSNRGGDILWRWGNPEVYRKGSVQDQSLYVPHDAKWVEQGYPDEGKISVFNNGGDGTGTFSSIDLISPVADSSGYTLQNQVFLPTQSDWSWHGAILGDTINENKKSGTHALPNGNMIICESSIGRISEINKSGDHLWSYRNPVGETIFNQNDNPGIEANSIFRGEKYPANFAGFSGIDLTPVGIIENQNILTENCISTIGIEVSVKESVTISNPVINRNIRFNSDISAKLISITDLSGKVVFQQKEFSGNNLNIDLTPAMYFIQLHIGDKSINRKIIVQ